MSVSNVSYKTITNLGWDSIELTNPVFHGDTLHAEGEVIGKRESESWGKAGIVTVETRGDKQTGDEVITFELTMLIPKREMEDS